MIVAFFGADSLTTKLPISPGSSPAATERTEVELSAGGRFFSTYVEEYQQATAAVVSLSITAAAADVWMMQTVALKPSGIVHNKTGLAAIGP
jgi:hypothetical protein